MYVCVPHVCLVPKEARIELYPLKVEFLTVVSCHVAHVRTHTHTIVSNIFKIKLEYNLCMLIQSKATLG